MCNRYTPPALTDIEREWQVGNRNPLRWWDETLFPRGQGPFIRRARDDAGYSRELVVGQWGLIPWFAKEPKLKYPTNNARSEELEAKASYKHPWARGQRCIIPAADFDEPNWETGKTCGGASAGRMAGRGAWLGCGTPGQTKPPARCTRATRCSRSMLTRIR